MNLIYDSAKGKMVRTWVHSGSSFGEVDDALYFHERPYYRYCACGTGSNPDEDQEWATERARLTALWHDKCPYKLDVDPCAVRGTGVIQRVLSWFK